MRKIAATAGILTAGTLLAVLGAGTAHADETTTPDPYLLGALALTETSSTTGVVSVTELDCYVGTDGTGTVQLTGVGGVADPDGACQELYAVDGDPGRLDVNPTWMTTNLYAPVTVTVMGGWGSAGVDWTDTYTNSSWVAKLTGDVFGFQG